MSLSRLKSLLLSMAFTAYPILGFAGNGGPGGGLCIKKTDECKLPAEVIDFRPANDPRIQRPSPPTESTSRYFISFKITEEHEKSVKNILKKLHLDLYLDETSFNVLALNILGGLNPDFGIVNENSNEIESIIKDLTEDYNQVFREMGISVPEEFKNLNTQNTAIPAFSVPFDPKRNHNTTTYFLKEFNDMNVNTERQGRIFIHEFCMRKKLTESRTRKEALKSCLNTDALIWDLLKNGLSGPKILLLIDDLKEDEYQSPLGTNQPLIIHEDLAGRPLFLGELTYLSENQMGESRDSFNLDLGFIQNYANELLPLYKKTKDSGNDRILFVPHGLTFELAKELAPLCERKQTYLARLAELGIPAGRAGNLIHYSKVAKKVVSFSCEDTTTVTYLFIGSSEKFNVYRKKN